MKELNKLTMMTPFEIKGIQFKNRIIRSSLGGQLATADGAVTKAFGNFEKRFAETGVSALVSATFSVNSKRYSPLYYPNIAHDDFIEPLQSEISYIQDKTNCNYIIQIGDPGAHTQMSLLPQNADSLSSSSVFDLLYGYRNHSTAMTKQEIQDLIISYANAAKRIVKTGARGIELTASKGYSIHQFLNPGFNRRNDEYGGSREKRFRFLREVVIAIREAIGSDFLFGVRLSTADFNYLPINLRLPPTFPLSGWVKGNGLPETTYYAKELESLGIDYLHLSRGFGFINPKESPGEFPLEEVRRVYNTVSHLSFKARIRQIFMNIVPDFLLKFIFGIGWNKELGATGKDALAFRKEVKIPIIVNGGFQNRSLIEDTLNSGACDMVSMARPLLANLNLLDIFKTSEEPEIPCTFCNKCSMLTAIVPVGCYDLTRFNNQDEMEQQILNLTHNFN